MPHNAAVAREQLRRRRLTTRCPTSKLYDDAGGNPALTVLVLVAELSLLSYWQACAQYGADSIGVNRRISSSRIVHTTEVTCDSQNVFEVSGQRGIPPDGVIAGLKMLELGSSENGYSRNSRTRTT